MSFFVIKMPVNSKGIGPESNSQKVVKTQWEIWQDGNYRTIVTFEDREEAEKYCAELNKKLEKASY